MVCRNTDSDIYYTQTSGKDYLVMDLGFISVVDKWTDWSYPYSDIYLVYEKVISLGGGFMMDAKKYIEEYNRMCKSYGLKCRSCPGNHIYCNTDNLEMIDIVEKWSKEHPKITNAMKFEEVFGFKLSRSNPSSEYLYMPENWLNQEYEPREKNADE